MKEVIDYKSYEKPSDFMKFKEGENLVRVASTGIFVTGHEFKAGGRFVNIDCTGEDCPQCAKGNEPKTKYLWIVIDRRSHKTKIMKVGSTIGNEVCMIGKKDDLKTADIRIYRTGMGFNNTKYQVSKVEESEPITSEEKKDAKLKIEKLKAKYF